jgi:fission process protein 1
MTSTNANDESITQQVKGEIDALVKKDVDSVESDIRYVAYGARLRTALRASSRYIAYVSGPRRLHFSHVRKVEFTR